jgi:hypothetical protein
MRVHHVQQSLMASVLQELNPGPVCASLRQVVDVKGSDTIMVSGLQISNYTVSSARRERYTMFTFLGKDARISLLSHFEVVRHD